MYAPGFLRRFAVRASALVALALSLIPATSPGQDPEIPPPLQPWVQWVIDGAGDDARCTWRHDAQTVAGCAWPSRLELDLSAEGGRFTQSWSVLSPSWVPLPGEASAWPSEVRVNDDVARVANREGVPALRLQPGEYRVSGGFRWNKLPARLPVPRESAIVRLILSGEPVVNPVRDNDGELALSHGAAAPGDRADRLDIAVFRRLIDTRPFQVHTHLVLDVSGVEREVVLSGVFLDQATPLRLEGALPIRLLADGRVQLQVRPGRVEFDLYSRLPGRVEAVRRGAVAPPLPAREVWSFDARRELRDVRPEGLSPVDPRQTRMPDAWRSLPAFVAASGATLRLVDASRGAEAPPRDQLSLARDLWLDFDGAGYTARDQLTGIAHGDQRLEVEAPIALGRVVAHGEPRLITRLAGSSAHGVEVRPGPVDLVADARVQPQGGDMPVSGWNRELRDVQTTLNLPPGWRLVAAPGADRVQGAWLDRWSMLDMFMVLILSIAAFRIWGAGAGVVALLALALTWHSAGAPQYVWVPVAVTSALVHAMKPSRLRRWIVAARFVSIVALVVVATPFLVNTARSVVFPQLEHGAPFLELPSALDDAMREALYERAADGVVTAEMKTRTESMRAVAGMSADLSVATAPASPPAPESAPDRAIDTALIQTGPGVPTWRWNRYQLAWNGPVSPGQSHRIVVLPPVVNRILDALRFLLSIALAAFMIVNRRRWFSAPGAGVVASAVAFSLAASIAGTERAVADDFPSPELLDELQRRVVEPPECLPYCVNLQSVLVTADEERIRVFYELTALDDVAVPLLLTSPTWSVDSVEVDGEAGRVLGDDGVPLVAVSAGSRLVEISGAVGDASEVELTFPVRPHRVLVESSSWRAAGMERPGGGDRQLRLYRERAGSEPTAGAPPTGLVEPYFDLTRTLVLGLQARVRNELRRLSEPGAPLSVDIQLLPGESPVSNVSVNAGAVRATFAPGQTVFRWESLFELSSPYLLEAPEDAHRVEHWQLDADPRWHVRSRGIAPVVTGGESGPVKSWRPWPGEVLELTLQRPDGVAGTTLTIDRSHLRVTPGRENTLNELSATLRSSQGGTHTVVLPENADVQSVRVDGEVHAVDPARREIAVPLRPGTRELWVQWQQPLGMQAIYRTSRVDLGAPSVNSTVELVPDRSRWLLWVYGPPLGPAVLYWGLLVFVLVAAGALARVRSVPIAWWQWFLLGAGIAHSSLWFTLPVLAWFLLVGYRDSLDGSAPKSVFNLSQIALVALTPFMLWALVSAIETGLLGNPDMQIAGNHSSAELLTWYQDRTDSLLPSALVVSVPVLTYRLLMLAWSLWLAFSLFNWLRWGWRAFCTGGTWRPIAWRRRKAATDTP